jgi:small-conductance mechanosensitive channel
MMFVIQTWADVTVQSFQVLWGGFIGFLPKLLGAIIIFLIGWIIAIGLEKLVDQILKVLRIDSLLEKMGAGRSLEKAGFKINTGQWLGTLVKWFIMIVFLMAATDILGLDKVTTFLTTILYYIPNVIVAVLIILVAVWAAHVLHKIILVSASATNIKAVNLSASLTKWSILLFGFLAALVQLGVAPGLIQTLATGFVAMLAIAGGVAFGLGGKEIAAEVLARLKRGISDVQ